MSNLKGAWIKPWGFALGAAAFLGWGAEKILPQQITLSPSGASVLVGAVTLIVIGISLQCWLAPIERTLSVPRVLMYQNGEAALLLLEPTDWLGMKSVCSIYFVEDSDFELLIGVGLVVNVQNDKKVQLAVSVRSDAPSAAKVWQDLDGGSKLYKQIAVKPGANSHV